MGSNPDLKISVFGLKHAVYSRVRLPLYAWDKGGCLWEMSRHYKLYGPVVGRRYEIFNGYKQLSPPITFRFSNLTVHLHCKIDRIHVYLNRPYNEACMQHITAHIHYECTIVHMIPDNYKHKQGNNE